MESKFEKACWIIAIVGCLIIAVLRAYEAYTLF